MSTRFITKGRGKDAKHIPINSKKGIRKSSFNNKTNKKLANYRVPILPNDPPKSKIEDNSNGFISVPNQGQIFSAFVESKKKSGWGTKGDTREQNIDEGDSYSDGWNRGIEFAENAFNDIGKVKIGTDISELDFGADQFDLGFKIIDSRDDKEEFVRQSAFNAEENDRQFSPFEITAKELDEKMFDEEGNQISDSFDAFEDGIGDAINWYVSWVFKNNEDEI